MVAGPGPVLGEGVVRYLDPTGAESARAGGDFEAHARSSSSEVSRYDMDGLTGVHAHG
jgi:hypothetical protein